jgi:hypothetical protein
MVCSPVPSLSFSLYLTLATVQPPMPFVSVLAAPLSLLYFPTVPVLKTCLPLWSMPCVSLQRPGPQRFGAASKAANFITKLHLENTIAAAASIRAGQRATRGTAPTRTGQGHARAAAPFRAGKGAARAAEQVRAGQGRARAAASPFAGQGFGREEIM